MAAGICGPMGRRDVAASFKWAARGSAPRATSPENCGGPGVALKVLRAHEIAALVVIGGNRIHSRALRRCMRTGAPVIGIASTIDNDLYGTDISHWRDHRHRCALHAIDLLRVTASSMKGAFWSK